MEITVSVDFGPLRDNLNAVGAVQFPRTSHAVQDATLIAQRLWLSIAGGNAVTFRGRELKVSRVSGAYARSIQDGLEFPADGDMLHGRVSASAEYAQAIEDGTPPHDMKPALLGGAKARMGKKGQRYNIIPFRHNTPGQDKTAPAMPAEIYAKARRLAFSQVTGSRPDVNAHGQGVQRKTYAWGGRLKETKIGWRSRTAPTGHEYTHTTSIFSGMVKMGKAKQASYMTFRVVSDRSPANAWWTPGVEPRPISEAVAETVRPQAEALIREAFEQDLLDLMNG
jgi:hypothetical protein